MSNVYSIVFEFNPKPSTLAILSDEISPGSSVSFAKIIVQYSTTAQQIVGSRTD
jgi:hypothetical protein